MAKTNVKPYSRPRPYGPKPKDSTAELLRLVSTCLLHENTFYRSGGSIAADIQRLCAGVSAEDLSLLAIEARHRLHLRHAPLLLVRELVRLHQGPLVGDTLSAVIRRPDEMGEFLSLYWGGPKRPGTHTKIPAQVKRGLRMAFGRFNEYSLAKYDKSDAPIKLRDVLFLCHAKPKDKAQAKLWKKLIDGKLDIPDTWETALSAGADKKATWERLLSDEKLGYQALLKNLRNMTQAGVSARLVNEAIMRESEDRGRAFPHQFVTAARYAPAFTSSLSAAMCAELSKQEKLVGSTAILVDVSGSMNAVLSSKGETTRMDAAASLAAILAEVCGTVGRDLHVFTFSNHVAQANPDAGRGLDLVKAIIESQPHGGTSLKAALDTVESVFPKLHRLIVVTDEQSTDGFREGWATHNYLVNVASERCGLDTRESWKRISGWSDRVVDWLRMEEAGGIEQILETARARYSEGQQKGFYGMLNVERNLHILGALALEKKPRKSPAKKKVTTAVKAKTKAKKAPAKRKAPKRK